MANLDNYHVPSLVDKLSIFHPHPLIRTKRDFACNCCGITNYGGMSNCCGECQYDICLTCEKTIKHKSQQTDLHEHELKLTNKVSAFICNVCDGQFEADRVSWCCEEDEFDVCIYCMYDAKKEKIHAHDLLPGPRRVYKCDVCTGSFPEPSVSFICLPCNFDACPTCFYAN